MQMAERKTDMHQISQDPVTKPLPPPKPKELALERENESFMHIEVQGNGTSSRDRRYVGEEYQPPRSVTSDSGASRREHHRDPREYRDQDLRYQREGEPRERDRERNGDTRERDVQSRALDSHPRQNLEPPTRREQAYADQSAPHSRSSPQRQQTSGTSQASWMSIFSQQRDTSQAEIAHLRRVIHEYDARETELRTQLAATERRLVVVTRDLEESRSFVAKEDSDAKELITSFEDINEAVDDLAYLISEFFDKKDAAVLIDVDTTTFPDAIQPILKVSAQNKFTLEDAIGPIICCLLHHTLYKHVFAQWSPNISQVKHEACVTLYDLICKREPQDRAARWRSMTYQNCDPARNDVEFADTLTAVFFQNLTSCFQQILPTPSNFNAQALTEKFSTTVNKIVHNAMRLQDKTKATYLSFDYEPFIAHANDAFERMRFDAMDKPSHWQFTRQVDSPVPYQDVILAPTSVGLRASKGVVGTKGEIIRSTKVVVRAKALVGRCVYVPRSQDMS